MTEDIFFTHTKPCSTCGGFERYKKSRLCVACWRVKKKNLWQQEKAKPLQARQPQKKQPEDWIYLGYVKFEDVQNPKL